MPRHLTMTRRQWLALAARGTAAWSLSPLAVGAQPARRPNVVLIVADDLGSTDLGCYGAADLHTPNLDGLAAAGVRFTDFYVAAPACTPSRASLLTGRHHPRILHYGVGLEREEVTLAELLRGAGYRTAAVGKWHLGFEAQGPLAQGFDHFYGFLHGAIDNYSHFYYWGQGAAPDLYRDSEAVQAPGRYFPDLMTDEAVTFIGQQGDSPFFLYLPFNLPHYPLQPPPETLRRYDGLADRRRARYAACVTAVDERVGRVLAALDAHGLRRDTIVVFLSDHGHSEEADAMGGGGRCAPFRGHKGTMLEGGIRVPCLASWPGRFPAGDVRSQPVASIDWLPTLAAACGAPLLDLAVDGHRLDDVIASPQAPPTHAALHFVWQQGAAVRQGPWKLVAEGSQVQLYNLADDPGESTDLAAARRDVTQRLIQLRREWIAGMRDDPTVARWYKLQ